MKTDIQIIWEFVEENFPDYSSSDEIANNSDLYKIVNEETEEGDCSEELLHEEYNGDPKNPQIRIDFLESQCKVYESAIINFMNKQKNKTV